MHKESANGVHLQQMIADVFSIIILGFLDSV